MPTLDEAIAAIKAGDKVTGRRILADILQADLENADAWLWLAAAVDTDAERRKYLQRVLEIEPEHPAARRGLAELNKKQAAPPPAARPEPPASPPPSGREQAPGPPAQPRSALDRLEGIDTPAPPRQARPSELVPPPPTDDLELPPVSSPPEPATDDLALPPTAEPSAGKARARTTPDEVMDQFRTELASSPAAEPAEPETESTQPQVKRRSTKAKKQAKGLARFLNSDEGLFALIGLTAMLLLGCAACVVFNFVFQPLASQVEATVAAVVSTDTPTVTPTPTPPPSPTSTPTATGTPTITPSPLSTRVVADTPTVTPTVSRTPTPDPNLQTAQVIGVISGDTIAVLLDDGEYRVRYLSIGAPAVNDPETGTEPFGEQALAVNRGLVGGQVVTLEKDVREADDEGRLLRYVYVDNLMVNEELLKLGMARVVLMPPDTRYGARLQEAEAEAKAQDVGIWSLE